MYERKNLDKEARAAAEILKTIKKKQRIEKHQGLNPKK